MKDEYGSDGKGLINGAKQDIEDIVDTLDMASNIPMSGPGAVAVGAKAVAKGAIFLAGKAKAAKKLLEKTPFTDKKLFRSVRGCKAKCNITSAADKN